MDSPRLMHLSSEQSFATGRSFCSAPASRARPRWSSGLPLYRRLWIALGRWFRTYRVWFDLVLSLEYADVYLPSWFCTWHQRIVKHFVVCSVKVVLCGHWRQYAFGIDYTSELSCGAERILATRCEVTGAKRDRLGLWKLTRSEWFHGAIRNLSRQQLLQMS